MRIIHHFNLPLAGAVLALTSLFNASIASADNLLCDGELGSGTYGNVRVAPGASCTIMNDVIIEGSLLAINAVNLNIQGTDPGDDTTVADCESATVKIHGNVKIRGLSGALEILDTCIEGNFAIKNSSASGGLVVLRSTINGNAKIRNNDAELIRFGSSEIGGTDIGGDVTVKWNSVTSYMVVNNGYIGGNLTVTSNFAEEEIAIKDRIIGGNLAFKYNDSIDDLILPQYFNVISGNHIDGNFTFKGNKAIDPVQINDNGIDGNMTCKRNDPDPKTFNNIVGGNSNCFNSGSLDN